MGQREGFQMTKKTWPRLVGLYVNANPGPGISAYPNIAAAVAGAAGLPVGYAAVIILEPGSENVIADPITLPATRDWFFVAKSRSGSLYGPPGGDVTLTQIVGAAISLATNAAGAARRQLGFDGVYSEVDLFETENWRIWWRDTVVNAIVTRTHGILGAELSVFGCHGNGNALRVVDTDVYAGAGPTGGRIVIVDSEFSYGMMAEEDIPFVFMGWIDVQLYRSRFDVYAMGTDLPVFECGGFRNDFRFYDSKLSFNNYGDDDSMMVFRNHGGLQHVRYYDSKFIIEAESTVVDLTGGADPTPEGYMTLDVGLDAIPLPSNIPVGTLVVDHAGFSMICTGLGKFQNGAVTIYDLVHVLSAVQAAQHDTGLATLAGDWIRSTNMQILETVTPDGGGLAVKVGLGNADPDLWGLTPSLAANAQWKKLDRGLDGAGTSLRLCACDAAGAAAGTIGGGKVRLRVEMERIITLASI